MTDATDLTFSSSAKKKRFVVWGVTAEIVPSSITLDPTSLERTIGASSETLAATVLPNNATNKTVTWTSDNTSVATVTSSGVVSFVGAGNATITAKTFNNLSATCSVTVTNPSYTITPTVNDANMGSVGINGVTITAAPNSGYRVIAGNGGYTVTNGTATVVNNGDNTFTVTPSSTCTVQINFEAIPTHTLNSNVSPDNSGKVTLGSSSVMEGSTTTATAEAEDGYEFTGWSITGTGASLSSDTDNPTTVTMGTANATITATFARIYTIRYSVNGAIVKTQNVVANNDVDLSAPTDGVPSGFVFQGWVVEANKIPTFTNDNPSANYVTSAKSTADITYYAVMACRTGMTNPSLTKLGSDATFSTNDNIVIVAKGTTYALYQETVSSNYVKNFSFVNNATTIGNDAKNYLTLTAVSESDDWYLGDKTNGYLYNSSSNYLALSNDKTKWTIEWNSTEKAFTIIGNSRWLSCRTDLNGDNQNKYRMGGATSGDPSGVVYFDIYRFVPSTTIYGKYCTTINTFNNDGNWNVAGKWSWNSVPTTEPAVTISAACTIPSGVTANVDNIIIADGGSLTIANGSQLITANPVTATVEKTINKPNGTWGQNDNTGWYAISSPVGNIAPGSVTNMTLDPGSTVPQYDLYKYVENMGWYNSQYSGQSISTLGKGCGYLYARSETATLSFTGSVVSDDVELTGLSKSDVKHSGLHLIGNPYTHTIYYGVAIDGDISNAGYYKLNSTGSWISTAAGTAIDPMEAVFVFVTKDNATVSFSNDASAPASKANHDYIQFTVANSQYEDVAYAMFDKGNGLNKIEHRNSEAPMIYIPQNDDNYAIAMMNDNTQMFGLNFKAATTGKYTLSYNTKGDYSYLHLIDRLTGEDIDMLIDNEYSFIGSPIDGDNRFIVKLTYNSGNDEINNDIFAYQNGNDIIVSEEGELQVYDVTGRFVMSEHINGIQSINIKSQGVYILRLMGLDVKTQKIVVR
ncbi:MAG: Ig-like domain-containing protein [Bacteroidales bacterium]|nr:Ig-like domain-containing protein [Bacteroidales bacterium]